MLDITPHEITAFTANEQVRGYVLVPLAFRRLGEFLGAQSEALELIEANIQPHAAGRGRFAPYVRLNLGLVEFLVDEESVERDDRMMVEKDPASVEVGYPSGLAVVGDLHLYAGVTWPEFVTNAGAGLRPLTDARISLDGQGVREGVTAFVNFARATYVMELASSEPDGPAAGDTSEAPAPVPGEDPRYREVTGA